MKHNLAKLNCLTTAIVIFSSLQHSADAAVVLTIEGAPGSPNFTIRGSGTNVMTNGIGALGSFFLSIPDGSLYRSPFNSFFGDILAGTPNFNDLIASSGSVHFTVTGSLSFSSAYDRLRILSSQPDEFALASLSSSSLPSLITGDSVTLGGIASFTLPSGTFDTVWNPGTYVVSPASNGGSYTIQITSIPELSSAFLIGIATCCGIFARTRQKK